VKWIAIDSFADHVFGFHSEEFYGTLMLNFQQLLSRRHVIFPRLLSYTVLGSFTKKLPLKNNNYYIFLADHLNSTFLVYCLAILPLLRKMKETHFVPKNLYEKFMKPLGKTLFAIHSDHVISSPLGAAQHVLFSNLACSLQH